MISLFILGCKGLRLVGNKKQRLQEFPIQQIRRVRLMRRADGYYAQFAADVQRRVEHVPTGLVVAVDGWIRI